jgi:hypothetical protein
MALILFWLGASTLLVSLVVGLQEVGAPNQAQLDDRYFAVPVWGIVAVIVALALRKGEHGFWLRLIAAIWLTSALAIAAWIEFGFD